MKCWSPEPYSVMNNYGYEGKSELLKTLDFLSFPARSALGGRNVRLVSLMAEEGSSLIGNVVMVVVSLFCFPIAAVTLTSLLIKSVVVIASGEKEKVCNQISGAKKAFQQFTELYEKGQQNEAINLYRKQPEIWGAQELQKKYYALLDARIRNDCSWEGLPQLLAVLPRGHVASLMSLALEKRLERKDAISTCVGEVKTFITKSLPERAKRVNYYPSFLKGFLKIDVRDPLMKNITKLVIADYLIKDLVGFRKLGASEFERRKADVEEQVLRHSLFTKGQDSIRLYQIFTSKEKIRKLSLYVSRIRNLALMRKIAEKMDQNPSFVLYRLYKAHSHLMNFTTDESEALVVEKLGEYCLALHDALEQRAPSDDWYSSLVDELQSLCSKLQSNLEPLNEFEDHFQAILSVLQKKDTADCISLIATLLVEGEKLVAKVRKAS